MKTLLKIVSGFFVSIFILGFGLYLFAYRPLVVNEAFFLPTQSFPAFERQPIDAEKLRDHVEFLAGIQPTRNVNNVESLNRAADYIRQEWEKMGLPVRAQIFSIGDKQYQNIYVDLPATESIKADSESVAQFGSELSPELKAGDSIIVIGAHYDVCEDQPGADDNASGVAGLIELTRLMVSSEAPSRALPVRLIAYTLEEPPTYNTENMGSYVHAKSLRDKGVEVALMISLEMIGFFSDEPNSQSFPIDLLKLDYPTVGNFIALVSNLENRDTVRFVRDAMKAGTDLPVYSINAPKSIPGIDFSDHRSYWHFGYTNALMLTDTSFYRNPNYHKPSDTPDTLDYDRMAQVVAGVYGVVSLYGSTKTQP